MASSVSMSGLVSNLDTDSIVSALVSSYSTKKDNLVKAQTKLEWTQDAWKDLNTKIYSFYSGKLSSMSFSVKKSTSSSTKATVTASSDSVTGTQKLKINQLATSGYLTGGVVSKADGTKLTGSSKLSELGVTSGSSISVSTGSGSTDISITDDMTVNQFVSKLKGAGVNASFDEKNQRFFVSSKSSGSEGEFSLTANNASGVSALSKMGLNVATDADVDKYRTLAGMSDDEIQATIDTAYAKQKTALYDITDEDSMNKIKENLQSALDAATDANSNLEKANSLIDFKLATLEELKDTSSTDTGSKVDMDKVNAALESTDKEIADINEQISALTDSDEDEEKKASLQSQLETLQNKREVYVLATNDTFNYDGYVEELEEEKTKNEETMASNQETINTSSAALESDEGFTSYIDTENSKITDSNNELKDSLTDFYNARTEDAKNYVASYDYVKDYELVNSDDVDKNSEAYSSAVSRMADYEANYNVEGKTSEELYKQAVQNVGNSSGSGTGAVRISGQDAIIELNGATFTSETNNFQINGLTIEVNALTDGDEEINITTDTDVDGIYNKIKDLFTSYNELIKEMDSLYNADSAKGYEPLTDDEKEAMTDSEIEKWEEKIKASLLRRDSTLGTVSDAIKNAFQKVYNINGTNYSLSSFGIKTGGYFTSEDNEKSMYHIDGDSEDSTSSGNTDKLRAAIASDPETVTSFFNQLFTGVYNELTRKMARTSLSSAYTVYNDKKMQSDYKSYTTSISEWEDRIETYEEKYRNQFTAMETALSKLNSNSSALSGLLS
jgi:flagellar hook-associated protein 2